MSDKFKTTESGLVWVPETDPSDYNQYPEIPASLMSDGGDGWGPFSEAGRSIEGLLAKETETAFYTGYVKCLQQVRITLRTHDEDDDRPCLVASNDDSDASFCIPLTIDSFEPEALGGSHEFPLMSATVTLEYENGETVTATFKRGTRGES
jgi:hypothetical protein